MIKITKSQHKGEKLVLKDGKLVAVIAKTNSCTTYGGDCWHLLYLSGRCDHHEKYTDARNDALKI